MTTPDLHAILEGCADAIEEALADLDVWSQPAGRPTQFECDVVADVAATSYLLEHGCGVISEESTASRLDRDVIVVVDPIDGTGNAVRGLPWFGPSLCALVEGRPVVSHVRNLATGERFDAEAGAGATHEGLAARPSRATAVHGALVGVSGPAPPELAAQGRALGAVAFALCAVAVGALDGFVDFDQDHHRCWDHLAGVLTCVEAGAIVTDAAGRDLHDLHHARAPVAAGTAPLHAELMARRAQATPGSYALAR
ncbi:MAG: inositol monophosphatase family protein [Acidimicrobiales bacterium]